MKNKEFIKKSIEENIVDHTAVLNNLKAKAAVLEAERASRRMGYGLKKAAIFGMLAVLCVTCALSSIYLFNSGSDMPPPVMNGSIQQNSVQSYESDDKVSSAPAVNSEYVTNSNSQNNESREPKSVSECSGIVVNNPLDDEEKEFFNNFADKFTVLQNLINARLDVEEDSNEPSEPTTNGYAKVTDENFKKISDIKDFLYSFMKPESAGEIFVGLTSGVLPSYMEKNGELYQKTNVKDNYILNIDTETAFLISKDENTLIINALLKTSGNLDYYRRFEFEKINGEWLYKEVW